MKEVFPQKPMVCFQRVKNLGEILTKARLPSGKQKRGRRHSEPGFRPCKKQRCPVCEPLHNKSTVRSIKVSNTGEQVQIKSKITCSSTNLIYCITCTRGGRVCPEHPQYIGETGQQAKERMREHRGTVIQPSHVNTTAPVGLHFRQSSHSVCDLNFTPFESINSKDPLVRKIREAYWINKFNSACRGLNIKKC